MNAHSFQSKNRITSSDTGQAQEVSVKTPASLNPARRAFSLPELLIVIAIIGVMATLILAVAQKAQEDARASATRSRIARIEAILNQELDAYEVRRLPVSSQVLLAAVGGTDAVAFRNLRKRILQDLINAEFPRPLGDLVTGFTFNDDLGKFPSERNPVDGSANNGLRQWLDTNYAGLGTNMANNLLPSSAISSWGDPRLNSPFFDLPGEYLYEVLQRVDKDGVPAIETLGGSAFGDTDNDEFLEILDGWNEPLLFEIVQVDARETPPNSGVFIDANDINWIRKNPETGMPAGYVRLNPTIPRDLSQIRFHVYSARLLAIDN